MFADSLPEHLNANRFIGAKEKLSGPLDPQDYSRFAEMAILEPYGLVKLFGSQEPYGPQVMLGEITCDATLVCQRCMQPVTYHLYGEIAWGLVYSETAMQSLDSVLDPILVSEGQIMLREAIEDELLLLLPIMPMHDTCDDIWMPDLEPEDVSEKLSPFMVLAALKK